jgi:hypothetical protein
MSSRVSTITVDPLLGHFISSSRERHTVVEWSLQLRVKVFPSFSLHSALSCIQPEMCMPLVSLQISSSKSRHLASSARFACSLAIKLSPPSLQGIDPSCASDHVFPVDLQCWKVNESVVGADVSRQGAAVEQCPPAVHLAGCCPSLLWHGLVQYVLASQRAALPVYAVSRPPWAKDDQVGVSRRVSDDYRRGMSCVSRPGTPEVVSCLVVSCLACVWPCPIAKGFVMIPGALFVRSEPSALPIRPVP